MNICNIFPSAYRNTAEEFEVASKSTALVGGWFIGMPWCSYLAIQEVLERAVYNGDNDVFTRNTLHTHANHGKVDIASCLRIWAWDPKRNRQPMVTYSYLTFSYHHMIGCAIFEASKIKFSRFPSRLNIYKSLTYIDFHDVSFSSKVKLAGAVTWPNQTNA